MTHIGVFKTIEPEDVNITPFKAHKNWDMTEANASSSYGVKTFRALYPHNVSGYSSNAFPIGSIKVANELKNPDASYQKVTWYSINNLFYKRALKRPHETFGGTDLTMIEKLSYETASVISIPQQVIGENIKPGSIIIVDKSVSASLAGASSVTYKDDQYGNIYDTTIDSGSMVQNRYLSGYWGFNEQFTTNRKKVPTGSILDRSVFKHDAKYINVTFNAGIKTTGNAIIASGNKASFAGDGFIWLENNHESLNHKYDKDFAISLWIDVPATQSNSGSEFNYIISKEGDEFKDYWDEQTASKTQYVRAYRGKNYPYVIKMYNHTSTEAGKLYVGKSDGIATSYVTSSTYITGSEKHIVFNKTGSVLELWIDGVKNASGSDTTTQNTHNNALLIMGAKGYNDSTGLSGSIDEVRFYDKGLSAAEVASLANNHFLSGSAYNTDRIGNVFYSQGIIVISDPRPKYQHAVLGNGAVAGNSFAYQTGSLGFDLTFKGAHTIYENEILCRIKEGEFNFSMNPTTRLYNDPDSQLVKRFITGSDFNPYITTIGLYNDSAQLLAIGKMATPILKKNDVDTTIIVRYDS